MRREFHDLSRQFEAQLRMSRRLKTGREMQVTTGACIGALCRHFEIAHTGGHALCMGNIRAGMESEPFLRRSVTRLATHASIRLHVFRESLRRGALHWRMTDVALFTFGRIRNSQRFRNPFASRCAEDGIRASVRIFLHPDDHLVVPFPPAMAAGRSARLEAGEAIRRAQRHSYESE